MQGTTAGGLVGTDAGTVTTSYWDTTTSGRTTSAGGTGQTTTALQTPTGATGMYSTWGTSQWDFGTGSQYPTLKGTGDWEDFGYQLRAGPSLTATGQGTQVVLTWTVDVSHWDPAPPVTYTIYRTTGSAIETVAQNVSGLQYTTTGATDTYQVAAVITGGETARSGWTAVGASGSNQAPTFPSTEDGARSVAENTGANVDIGDPVAAIDVDADTLTYSLSGTDATSFAINTATGQLRTKAGVTYDHETTASYRVTVSVHDGKAADNTADTTSDATIAVTITVTDVNEPPVFPAGTPTTVRVAEGTPPGRAIADFSVPDPDTRTPAYATLRYWLSGAEASVFFLERATGQLQTREPLDYESRSSYSVSVHVRDGKDAGGNDAQREEDARLAVTILVGNEDEAGLVTLSSDSPQEKHELTATLSDLDGSLSGIGWQWARAATRTGTGTPIAGATTARYTPDADDVGQYLRATASYTDGHGMGKAEAATTTAPCAGRAADFLGSVSCPRITEQGGVSTVTARLDPRRHR